SHVWCAEQSSEAILPGSESSHETVRRTLAATSEGAGGTSARRSRHHITAAAVVESSRWKASGEIMGGDRPVNHAVTGTWISTGGSTPAKDRRWRRRRSHGMISLGVYGA